MPFPLPFPLSLSGITTLQGWYARMIKQLFPPGKLWLFEADSSFSRLALSMAGEFGRVHERGMDLVNESDPTTTAEMIEDWEEMLALPDEFVTEIPATLAERRLAVTSKLVSRGGQNPAFFIELAAACGYTVTVTKMVTEMLRVGFRVGDRVYGDLYANTFRLNVAAPAGETLSHEDFEATIRRAVHLHAQVVFEYA